MAIDFPDNPSVNDTYTIGDKIYKWNGEKWMIATTGLTGAQGPQGAAGSWSTTQSINSQTGSTYTPTSSDNGVLVTLSNSASTTVTIDSTVSLSSGQRIDFVQLGSGQVTFSNSVPLYATPGAKLRAQYSAATLVCLSPNTYLLVGDLSA